MQKTVANIIDDKGRDIWAIDAADSVYQALEMMADKNVGALVVNSDGTFCGILSERDYARKVILKGLHSKDTHVSDIMTRNVICVTSEIGVDACMSLMPDNHVRHLMVRDAERLSGVISIGDVVKAIIEDQQFTIEQLEHYISGG